jgi:OOP family OmpA-OmpF porin
MNLAKLSLAALLAASGLGMTGSAAAQRNVTDAYAVDPSGVIVKNPFGLCWRTSSWTAQKAVKDCDPALFPAPVAAAPAPAPAPVVAAPPPPPPPVVARVVDSDGDGVPDGADRCPGTPSGAHVNAAGCELDADADGVIDRLDKCPGTKAGVRVDGVGCEIADVIILKGVNFANNSARLTSDSLPVLDAAAETLSKRANVSTEIAGYTDDRGSEEHNHVLSQRRADAVKDYLVSKGVAPSQLSSRGYGEESPIANNKTASGRAANRRVEMRTQ